ncbi:hypothetical protein JZU57_01445, partial [bacterium]|nr:hypothetical protein [bacterium]
RSDGTLALPPRELARFSLGVPDERYRALARQGGKEAAYAFSRGQSDCLIISSLTLHPVYIDTRGLSLASNINPTAPPWVEVPSRLNCPENQIGYFQDSDQFWCVELIIPISSGDTMEHNVGEQADDFINFAARHLFGRLTFERHLSHLRHPIFCHGDDMLIPATLPPSVDQLWGRVQTLTPQARQHCRDPRHPGWGWLASPESTPLPPRSAQRPRFHHTVVVWGETYVDLFLNGCLLSLLAPGNIPGMDSNSDSSFNIYTTEDDAAYMNKYPTIEKLRQYIIVKFHTIGSCEALQAFSDNRYVILSAFHRCAHELARAEDAFLTFISPDGVMSDGAFSAVERRVAAGWDVVLVTGIRTELENVAPWLRTQIGADGSLPLRSEDMVRIGLRHLHSSTRSHVWGSPDFNSDWPSQLFWPDGDDLMIAHCWQLHP